MRIELTNRRNTVIFFAGAALLAFLYLFWVQNHYRASASSETLSFDGLSKAVRLEPSNAESHDMLGRYYLFGLQDTKSAAAEFQESVRLDPHSSRYWLDVATVQGLAGDTTSQRSALENALQADPKTPKVAWEAGNFFLVDGDLSRALRSFKTVIEYDPVALPSALALCWRASHDVDMILREAMPPNVEAHFVLVHLLYTQKEPDAAMRAWRALVALNQPYKPTEAMPFVEYLIQERRVEDAQEVWSGMEKLSPSLRPATADGNLIVNGNFEEEIIPGGFSWRVAPPASQTIRIDDREIHAGINSVSFTFEGPAFSDYGFSQLAEVKPNHLYELSVSAKTQEIQSADGPRIIVEDAFEHTPLAMGSEWMGTHGWDEQKIMFTTKPATHAIRIYIGRATGGGLIRGRLWLDDVRLYER